MDTQVEYQVVFSGRLRNGYEPEAVMATLAQRLKLSPEQVERLFANGDTVLKKTPSEEQAKRIVMQLASAGVVTSIVSSASEAKAPPQQAPAPTEAPPSKPKAKTRRAAPRKATLPKFSPFRPKALFKPMLYAAAATELLLGLFYVLFILGLLGGVIGPSLFTTWGGQLLNSPLLGLPLQVVAFLLGTLALLIALKPLLALRPGRQHGIVISAEQEPDLHAFIEDVCERIRAPMPSEVRLYNGTAMRTSYRQGPLGFLLNRPVLSIGVSLIAGLNCSQLAALIAQSLNRYRYTNAPHATAILLNSHAWLQRAAFEDDPLEAAVRRWHDEGRLGDGLYRILSRLFAAGRRLVYTRLRLSRRLERRLVHRSIAESDKIALAFTGTEGYIRLLDKTSLLAHANDSILSGLKDHWAAQHELPDNLVHMMVLRSHRYPVALPPKLRNRQQQQKAAIGDVLPSDTQRLQYIAHQKIEGNYDCVSPAATLFRSYAKLTHTMTLRFYHHRLQLPVSPYHLKQMAAKGSLPYQLQQQLEHYFQQLYTDFVPLKLRHHMHACHSAAEAKQQWQNAASQLSTESDRARLVRTRFSETEQALIDHTCREEMILAGLGQRWNEEKLKKGELEAVHQNARDAEAEHEQAVHSLEQYLKTHAMRLGAALVLLDQAQNEALAKEAHLLVSLLERIEHVHDQLRLLELHAILLETLLSYRTVEKTATLDDRIEQRAADCHQLATAIRVALKSAPYPFGDSKATSLMNYVLQESLHDVSPQGEFDRGYDTLKRLALVQRRIVVRLIEIAEQVEQEQGLATPG